MAKQWVAYCAGVCVLGAMLALAASPCQGAPMTMTGMVMDTDGEPLAGCLVGTWRALDEAGKVREWVETTTGPDGRYELRFECERASKIHSMLVRHSGYGMGLVIVRPGEDRRTALRPSRVAMSGTAVDHNGVLLAGVELVISSLFIMRPGGGGSTHSLHGSSSPLRAMTDGEGRFRFEDLPPESAVGLQALPEGATPYTCGLQRDYPRAAEGITVVLYPAATISGRVLAYGEPAPDALVWIRTGMDSTGARSNADGRYESRWLPPGAYSLRAGRRGSHIGGATVTVQLEAGQRLEGVDVQIIDGAVIEGTVTAAGSGEPVSGVRVSGVCRDAQQSQDTSRTDEHGHYSLRVEPGVYRVSCYYASGSGGDEQHQSRDVEAADRGHYPNVDFEVPAQTHIAGRVLTQDGRAVPEMRVAVGPAGSSALPIRVRTDDQGRFRILLEGRARQGPWVVLASDGDRNLAGLTVLSQLTEEAEVRVGPGGYVAGRIQDAEGRPIHDARIIVRVLLDREQEAYLPLWTSTNSDGEVHLYPLPTGYGVEIEASYTAALRRTVPTGWRVAKVTVADEVAWLPTFRIDAGGRSVSGVCMAHDGRPVPGTTVGCTSTVNRIAAVGGTDELGRFELKGLVPEGEIEVIALCVARELGAVLLLDPDAMPEVTIALLPLTTLEYVVHDRAGDPLPGASVLCSSQGRGWGGAMPPGMARVERCTTGADGRCRFEQLIPGMEYQLHLSSPERKFESRTDHITPEPGPDPTIKNVYVF